MVSKSKAKGTYHEKFFEKLFNSLGVRTKRQPLSGSLGGEYSGDLVLDFDGRQLIAEVKYRKQSSFPSPFTVLENRDVAIYKRGTDRKWLLIVPGELVEEILNEYQTKNT